MSLFLANCPSLLYLNLFTPDDNDESLNHYLPVTLPKLESLSVYWPKFGSLMTTPRLKELCCLYSAISVTETAPLPILDHLTIDAAPDYLLKD